MHCLPRLLEEVKEAHLSRCFAGPHLPARLTPSDLSDSACACWMAEAVLRGSAALTSGLRENLLVIEAGVDGLF